jgi:hypothetical protein
MSDEPETVDAEAVEQPELSSEEQIARAAEAAAATGMFAGDVSDADDFKPAGRELVVTPDRDVYRVMDRADEIQILDELQGRALEAMVYSFSSGGQQITDLTYAGVREVVRTLNRDRYTAIRISGIVPPKIEEFTEDGESYYRVMVYAEDIATGLGQWGTATEPKHIGKSKPKWDKFALTKALNKAQRNAMKAVIPLEFQQTIVAQFLGDESKVRRIAAGPGAEALAELPPPLEDDLMKELQNNARERYRVLQELNRLAMLPAAFNAYLTRTAHDHQRTRDMVEHIEGLIVQENARREAQEVQP